jgi:hypothetical protein
MAWTREQYRAYHKKWRNANPEKMKKYRDKVMKRNRIVIDEGKNKPCMDCGQTFPLCCMDYDHRVPADKKKEIGRMLAEGSPKALKKEIAKCDVVCANCHRVRTHGVP